MKVTISREVEVKQEVAFSKVELDWTYAGYYWGAHGEVNGDCGMPLVWGNDGWLLDKHLAGAKYFNTVEDALYDWYRWFEGAIIELSYWASRKTAEGRTG